MVDRNLIILTRRFPYFKTEAFLESEIDFVSKKFNKVYIYPSEINYEKRNLPDNVIVCEDFSFKFQNKSQRIFSTLFSNIFWSSLLDQKKSLKGISDYILLFKFISNALVYYNYFDQNPVLNGSSIVYSYWFNAAPFGMIKLKIKNSLSFKIIARAHRYDIYEGLPSTPRFWPYRDYVLKNITNVFSISSDGKKYIESKYTGLPNEKVGISRLGVLDHGILSTRSKSKLVTVISVSRITPMKRVDFIFSCLNVFAINNPDLSIKWIHFGDGELYKSVSDISSKSSINLFVDLRGAVSNRVIYDFYSTNSVDLFINLSLSEGIPVSIMEAQSFGIPTIATDVGGNSEIVNDQNGALIDPFLSEIEVSEVISTVLFKCIEPLIVKQSWKNNFDATINYTAFANTLSKL
ncbi:glycosyltransferase [uncultured Algoriphagus sp.]|uniref:glycosyltransferase n=1 Tax=uncultured Algoriphagus sp. TaxID=417365 RepID=UPI0030ED6C1B|tara:strand:- start:866 stop:2083 length:1218 start_codon:yes stop_codon:yes gene_type:complete